MTAKLGNLTSVLSGFAFKSELFGQTGGMPLVRIRDVVRGKSETNYAGPYEEKYVVADGDMLIGMDGEFNLARWQGGPALLNQRVCRIRSNSDRLHDGYLYWYLPKALKSIEDRTPYVTVKHLSVRDLADIEIPIPFPDDPGRSLAEQERIAAILDSADGIRRRRREATRLADSLIPNLYLELFGDPLANDRNWPMAKVETLCDLVRGSSPRPRSDPTFYGGPVPRLMIEDITRDGKYVTPRIDSLTELGATMSRPVVAGTIVMAVSGNVGLVARVQVDACIHDGFVGFKDLDTKAVRPDYFMWTLDLLKASHAKRKAGAIWQNLTTHQVKAMEIPLPSPRIQDRFEKLSKRMVEFTKDYAARVDVVEGLFNSLVQRAFRGEL